MKTKYYLTDAEWEVMQMLWKQEGGIKQSVLLEKFHAEGKEWKRQTLNTFLSNLEEKGLVKRENRVVSVVIGEEEYKFLQVEEAIETMYEGKLSKFIGAFQKKNVISEEEVKELQELLKES